jgi:hypothetical protein
LPHGHGDNAASIFHESGFLLGSWMSPLLQTAAILSIRALRWVGGQGTRAIAALVFIGIAVPPLSALLKPYVTHAVFVLLCISFMRVDLAVLRSYLRRPAIVLSATVWTGPC